MATIELRDDFHGLVPGHTLLGSWNVSGVSGGLVGLYVSGRVEAGKKYWITIQPGASDTVLGWVLNTQGVAVGAP